MTAELKLKLSATAELKLKLSVLGLVCRGTYPSPRAVRLALEDCREAGGLPRRAPPPQLNNLNGRECRWRDEVLTRLGWTHWTALGPRRGDPPNMRRDRKRSWTAPDWWAEGRGVSPDGGALPDRGYITGCGEILSNVHVPEDDCWRHGCVIHNPTDHACRGMRTRWRYDRGIMERVCEHGVGHPDPDDQAFITSVRGEGHMEGVHGCDGCCAEAG